MHTPNDEIKTNTFLPVSDVGGEETYFFMFFFFNAESKIPYQQFLISPIYIKEL